MKWSNYNKVGRINESYKIFLLDTKYNKQLLKGKYNSTQQMKW